MGSFRLFRRIKIAPGVTINVSKSGLSTSLGPRGAKVTFGRRGVRKTVGIPGTGLYYTSTSAAHEATRAAHEQATAGSADGAPARGRWRLWVGLAGLVALGALIGSNLGATTADPPGDPGRPPLGVVDQPVSTDPIVTPDETSAPYETTSPDGTSAPSDPPAATPRAATGKPKATSKPAPRATAKVTPRPASTGTSALPLKITSHTATVGRNGTATAAIRTAAGASCSIEVDYASGPSRAAGLVDKTASSTGVASWSWRIGGRTADGTYPIDITCSVGGRSASAEASFTVR